MSNEYQPWIELGISELEYFKQRYLESRVESEHMRRALEAVVNRYESVGDSVSRKQGVSFGIYTVCKRALADAERVVERKE
jgi:hypothetical protein